jgi:hypothetical protein
MDKDMQRSPTYIVCCSDWPAFFEKLAPIICSTTNEGELIFEASAFLGLISEQTELSDKYYTTILNTKKLQNEYPSL